MTYSLELEFIKSQDLDRPHRPVADIWVKTHSQDAKGRIIITPNCLSFSELEVQIDRLQKELETIRKEAKRKFSLEKK
jgi:hypothetical protein